MEKTKPMLPMKSALPTVKKTSQTVTTSIENKKKEVPEGAIIISSTITTSTEQIENGWLVTKNYDVRFRPKGSSSDSYGDYAYYSKKWYTKSDPLEVTLTDKSLADAFDDTK